MSHVVVFCRTPLGAGHGFGADLLHLNLGASPKSAQTRFQQALRDLPEGHPFRFVCCAVSSIQFGQIVHPFLEFFALYVFSVIKPDVAIASGAGFNEFELVHEIVRQHQLDAEVLAEARIQTTLAPYRKFASALGFLQQFLEELHRVRTAYEVRISTPHRLGATA